MIDETIAAHLPVGAPATWVLSNHDVTRHVTRYGRADTTLRLRRPRPRPARWTWSSAPAGPAPPRCCTWRCPAAPTSTRARNSACGRSRTSRTSCEQDPMWLAHRRRRPRPRRLPGAAALVRADAPPFGFSPDGASAAAVAADAARRLERDSPSRRRPATRTRCSSSTAAPCALRHAEPGLRSDREPLRWLASARGARLPPRRRVRLRGQLRPPSRRAARARRDPARQRPARRRRPAAPGHRRLAAS